MKSRISAKEFAVITVGTAIIAAAVLSALLLYVSMGQMLIPNLPLPAFLSMQTQHTLLRFNNLSIKIVKTGQQACWEQ